MVEYLDPQIQRVITIGLCGFTAILVIALWPEEVEEEELIDPETARMMETIEQINQHLDVGKGIRESLKKAGWKTRKVKRLKWPWQN